MFTKPMWESTRSHITSTGKFYRRGVLLNKAISVSYAQHHHGINLLPNVKRVAQSQWLSMPQNCNQSTLSPILSRWVLERNHNAWPSHNQIIQVKDLCRAGLSESSCLGRRMDNLLDNLGSKSALVGHTHIGSESAVWDPLGGCARSGLFEHTINLLE